MLHTLIHQSTFHTPIPTTPSNHPPHLFTENRTAYPYTDHFHPPPSIHIYPPHLPNPSILFNHMCILPNHQPSIHPIHLLHPPTTTTNHIRPPIQSFCIAFCLFMSLSVYMS